MATDHVVATYLVETALGLEQSVEILAGEQSTGTFVRVPGETQVLRREFRARVDEIVPLGDTDTASLPGAAVPPRSSDGLRYRRGRVTVSFPLDNMGPSVTALLSTVAGNLFELREFSGVRLLDIELPTQFATRYPGPQFGIAGTRRLAAVHGRPLIGTIVKPSVGLTPEATADLVRQLGMAGIDFIKDDELMANPPHSALQHRVEAVTRVIDDLEAQTGRRIMYAFNISDDLEAMLRHHDTVLRSGGTCVMVSLNAVGVVGVESLRRHSQLPIHGHRNGWGMLTRHPLLGMEFTAYQKIWRLLGVDHLHVNGLDSKFWEPNESVVRSVRACLTPMLGGYVAMPVISSGQWGGQAPQTYALTQTVDVIYLAGGGLMAHPGGPACGVRAIRQAWEAAVAGILLTDYAKNHKELQQAIDKFGSKGESG